MTEPLTPPDCDCRGLPFMPLEVNRLLDSDMVALSTGDEFKAALILWAKSWAQVPAASLPDDDRILAKWAGYSLTEWRALREMALRGWVTCSDGRLYHPVVADLALSAQAKRKGQAEKANSRWAKVRAEKSAAGNAVAEKSGAAARAADAAAMQVKGTVEGTEPPLAPQGASFDLIPDEQEIDEIEVAFSEWNAVAKRCGLPVAKTLDKARRRSIGARLKEGGLGGWREALAAVERSAFCRGQRAGADGRKFKADLTFVCRASAYPRLREGGYGDDAVRVSEAVHVRPFPHPGVRQFVLDKRGGDDRAETWVRAWLDPCDWVEATRTIVAPRELTADRLRQDVPGLDRQVTITVASADAPAGKDAA